MAELWGRRQLCPSCGALSALAPAPGWPSRPVHRGSLRAPGPCCEKPPTSSRDLTSFALPARVPIRSDSPRESEAGSEEAESLGALPAVVTQSGSIKRLGQSQWQGTRTVRPAGASLRLFQTKRDACGSHRGSRNSQALARLNHGFLHLGLPSGRGCGLRPLLSHTDSSNP